MAQLVEALRCKPESRGFDGIIGIFSLTLTFGRTVALGSTHPVTEMSTRDISSGGKGGRCVWLTTLPSSYADCLELLGALTS